MEYFVGFVIGVIVGAGIALVAGAIRARAARLQMREAFATLASEALDSNSRRLSEMTGAALDGKKELIDRSVTAVNERLEQVRSFLQRIETERKQDFGHLSSSVSSLSLTAGKLHEMLASTQRRGAWGERMTEDILRLVGMQEGVNYVKQSSQDADSGRPDFTFLLPNDLKANMDVKFPLESYRAYLDATDDETRTACMRQLVLAVRGHIRSVAGRGYIDPKVPTVPYVIVFLASEQLFSLVLSAEPDLIDEALHRRVVLAGPLTLYAMLSVMRQAAENANLMRTADEVISLLGQFHKQWDNYNQEMDKLGDRLESAIKQFDALRTTRTNQLQKPLDKIEELRTARALPEEADA